MRLVLALALSAALAAPASSQLVEVGDFALVQRVHQNPDSASFQAMTMSKETEGMLSWGCSEDGGVVQLSTRSELLAPGFERLFVWFAHSGETRSNYVDWDASHDGDGVLSLANVDSFTQYAATVDGVEISVRIVGEGNYQFGFSVRGLSEVLSRAPCTF